MPDACPQPHVVERRGEWIVWPHGAFDLEHRGRGWLTFRCCACGCTFRFRAE